MAEAAETLERARNLFAQLDLRTELGQAHLARGYVLARQGEEEDAREELVKARAIFRDADAPVDEARVLSELGRLERLQGRTSAAVELLRAACDILEGRDVPELALATRELGVCFATDDEARAEKVLREAAELFERCDETVQLAATQRALGDVLASSGNRDAACEAYRVGILAVEERL
jgi:tetratricopeptide (TPR) repeat protein